MACSSKDNQKFFKSINKNELSISKIEKRESSLEKPRKAMHLKDTFYEKDNIKHGKTNLTLLNYISNISERKSSIKTALTTSIPEVYDYTLCMVNKYEENLNLSFISDFDLEDDKSKVNDSFDSCFDDNSVEQIEIQTKSNIIKNEETEIDLELEKEWNDIKDLILDKKSYQ